MTINDSFSSGLRGQLGAEWRRHCDAALFPVGFLLLATFAYPLLSSVTSIAVCFSVVGAFVATRIAASDAMAGTEEFSISMPATRTERYLSGLLLVLIIPLSAWIALALMVHSAAPRLWSLWVESGYTPHYTHYGNPQTRMLAVTIPALVTALCFTLGSLARTPVAALVATAVSIAGCGAISAACMTVEDRIRGEASGELLLWVSAAALLPILLAGWLLYRKKEVTGGEQTSKAALLFIVIGALILLFMLLAGLLWTKPVRIESHEGGTTASVSELLTPVEVTP